MKEIDFIPDEKASELIDKVKKKAGLKTDQEALNMILHDAAKNFGKSESKVVQIRSKDILEETEEMTSEHTDDVNYFLSKRYEW